MSHFSLIAQIIVLNIDIDAAGYLGPPVVTKYELKGLEVA
jgi:hypothetical protein